jgi:hypothetical protein
MKLENFNVEEITEETQSSISGGLWWVVGAAAALVAEHLITESLFNPGAHSDAYWKGRRDGCGCP